MSALEARLAALPADNTFTAKLAELRLLEGDLRQDVEKARRAQGEAKAREIAARIERQEQEIAEAKTRYEMALEAGRAFRRSVTGALTPWPELAFQAKAWGIEPQREPSPTARTLDAGIAYLDALIAYAPTIGRQIAGDEAPGALAIEWNLLNEALGFLNHSGALVAKRARLEQLRSRVN